MAFHPRRVARSRWRAACRAGYPCWLRLGPSHSQYRGRALDGALQRLARKGSLRPVGFWSEARPKIRCRSRRAPSSSGGMFGRDHAHWGDWMTGLEHRIRDWNQRGMPFKWFVSLAVVAAVLGAPLVPTVLRDAFHLSPGWSANAIGSFAIAAVAGIGFLFAAVNLWLRSAGLIDVLDVTPNTQTPVARSTALTLALGLLALSIGINIGKTIFS